jgi:cysteine desulfurase/selenocysteine lyase
MLWSIRRRHCRLPGLSGVLAEGLLLDGFGHRLRAKELLMTADTIQTLDVQTLATWLAERRPLTLLDIRPTHQHDTWAIPGSIHVDAAEAIANMRMQALDRLSLPRDQPVVTICAAGRISALAAAYLQDRGYQALSLANGMAAWSLAWNARPIDLPGCPATVIQIHRLGKGCLSYLIGSGDSAAVIDPSLPLEIYLQLARERRWRITHVVETHIHADHLSRARSLALACGARLVLPVQNRVAFPSDLVGDGAVITVGDTQLHVLATPGHTGESVTYRLEDYALFTGDTLSLNGIGRPDLDKDRAAATAQCAMLAASLRTLWALADGLVVLPGHTDTSDPACSQPIARSLAPLRAQFHRADQSETAFIAGILGHLPPPPPHYQAILQFNEAGECPEERSVVLEAGANHCMVSTAGAGRTEPARSDRPTVALRVIDPTWDRQVTLVGTDVEVPLLNGQTIRAVNFDHAASTPPFQHVLAAVNRCMEWYSSVHRGAGFKSRLATAAFEAARVQIGRFVGARPDQHTVIFGKNTTEAINTLADCLDLTPRSVVLCSQMEHHSNLLPWRRTATVRIIRTDAWGRIDEAHLLELLDQHAPHVRLVAISGASNVTGHLPDLPAIARHVHAAGAELMVDGAQLAAHRAIDLGAWDDPARIDYVTLAGHKMYAPFGSGALIGRRDTFAQAIPRVVGGGSAAMVTADEVRWKAAPERHEAGTPNLSGIIALAAAAETLAALGMPAIAAHETSLTAYALRELAGVPDLRLYGDTAPDGAHTRLGIFPFTIVGVPHGKIAAILSAEFGIAVRNGAFCAQPYVRALLHADDDAVVCGESADRTADDAGMVRASVGIATTTAEVDRLVEGLRAVAAGTYQGTYRRDPYTGHYDAVGWEPDFSAYLRPVHQES